MYVINIDVGVTIDYEIEQNISLFMYSWILIGIVNIYKRPYFIHISCSQIVRGMSESPKEGHIDLKSPNRYFLCIFHIKTYMQFK